MPYARLHPRGRLSAAEWVKLNRPWWAIARPGAPCAPPAEPDLTRDFTIRGGGRTIAGGLPLDPSELAALPDGPCKASMQLAAWMPDYVATMNPP